MLAFAILPLFACTRADFSPRPVGAAYLSQDPANVLLEEAATQLGMGNVALAIGTFRRALRQAPDSPQAYVGLAVCYERLGRLDLAQRYYREGLIAVPDKAELAASYSAFLARHGIDVGALVEAPAVPAVAPAEDVPDATMMVRSVTIELAPLPETPGPRLERISAGEVELVTRPSPPDAQSASARRVADGGPVRVLNAVGRRGQAARMERHLRTIGWTQVSVGDASSRRARSFIASPPRSADAARRLSQALSFRPMVTISPSARQVSLVLGRDAVPFDRRLTGGAT